MNYNTQEKIILGAITYVIANPFAWIAIAILYTAVTGK